MPITFNNISIVPADTAGNFDDNTTVAYPTGSVAGDLMVGFIAEKSGGGAATVSAAGQTVNTLTSHEDATSCVLRLFWWRYTGSGSSPIFAPGVPGQFNTFTAGIIGFHPSDADNTWEIDVAESASTYAAPGSPFDVTTTGLSAIASSGVFVNINTAVDYITWALQTGGWSNPGTAQYRNSGNSDLSLSLLYKIFTASGSSGNVTTRQSSAAAGWKSIIAFKEVSSDPDAGWTDESTSATPGATSFTVNQSLVQTSSYNIRLKAINAFGTSYSNEITMVTDTITTPTITAGTPTSSTLPFTISGGNGDTWTVQFKTTAAGSYTNESTNISVGATSFTVDQSLTESTAYNVRISVNGGAAYSNVLTMSTAASGSSDAEADWIARSTAAGVVQALRFSSATNVTNYTHGDGTAARVVHDATDGIIGDGCLKFDVLSTDTSGSGNWRCPLNSSWTTDGQGFGNTTWYAQWRVKLGPNRLLASAGGGGFKMSIFGGYKPASPNSSNSHIAGEVVTHNNYYFGAMTAYYDDGSSTPPFEEYEPTSGLYKHQNAVDHGAGAAAPYDRYCVFGGAGDASAGCWFMEEHVWFTVYTRFKVGTYGGTTGNEFDLYVARDGEISYTHLITQTDFLIGDDVDYPLGANGMWFTPFDTGRTSADYETWQKYDQLIVSTSPIACPQVAAVNPLPLWAQALTDKVVVTPTNNATANTAGTAWIGGTGVKDPLATSTNAGGGHNGVINAYSGSSVDQKRAEYGFIANGGHSDYYGNEVYILPLRNDVLQWVRARDATAAEGGGSGNYIAWSDGTPASHHSYSMTAASDGKHAICGIGPGPYNGNGDNRRVFTFSRDTANWTDHGNLIAGSPYGGNQIGFYDKLNDQFLVVQGGGTSPSVVRITRNTMAVASTISDNINNPPDVGSALAGGFDTINRILLVRTSTNWARIKLDAGTPTWAHDVTPTGSGPAYPDSFVYHAPSRAFFGWLDGTGLVKLTPTVSGGDYTALAWSAVSGISGASVSNVGGSGGYSRFAIIDDIGGSKSVVCYVPAYENPSPYIIPIPLGGL